MQTRCSKVNTKLLHLAVYTDISCFNQAFKINLIFSWTGFSTRNIKVNLCMHKITLFWKTPRSVRCLRACHERRKRTEIETKLCTRVLQLYATNVGLRWACEALCNTAALQYFAVSHPSKCAVVVALLWKQLCSYSNLDGGSTELRPQ